MARPSWLWNTIGTADASVTVTPDVAALVITAFAPTVTTTAHQTVTPTTATLTTATFAPTVTASDHKSVTPTTAALVTAAFAPTVSVSDNQVVTPSTAALTTSLFAPTVTTSANVTVTPTTADLLLTTFAPTVTGGQGLTVIPDTAALTITTFDPTVTATATAAPGEGLPEPAGLPARDMRDPRRRRYIMPDGRTFIATVEEALALLRLYSAPKDAIKKLTAAPSTATAISTPQLTLERRDVRFVPVVDALPDTYRAVISKNFVYRAPEGAYRQAEMALNRIRDDEEAIIALLM